MSIYDKIAEIQMELLDVEFETKRGFHGEYMNLPVLTCKILPLCYKHKLFYYFTADDTHLILKIIDRETGEVLSPAPHVRLPELSKDRNVEGGNYTYMKRYLLMDTFQVIAEAFDPEDTKDGLPPQKKNDAGSAKTSTTSKKEEVTELNMGDLVLQAKEKLEKKGVNEKEITYKALKNTILNMKTWKVPERRCILNYFKEKEASK